MMFDLQTTMKLLGVVGLCLVTWSEITRGEENGQILRDRSEENIPGAAPEPYITAFRETERLVLLQCEVQVASPKPKVEWRNGAGDVINAKEPQVTESEGGYKIVLIAYVFKADEYRCVVTQEEIGHQTETRIDVHMKDFSSEWIIDLVFDIIIAAVIVFAIARACVKAHREYGSRSNQDPEPETTAAGENTAILNP